MTGDSLYRDMQGNEVEPGATPEESLDPDQGALFDLRALTVRAPDADIKEHMDSIGASTDARLDTFQNAVIKQMVSYFPLAEYSGMVERMRVVMQRTGVKDHTRAFVKLLEHWEASNGITRSAQ